MGQVILVLLIDNPLYAYMRSKLDLFAIFISILGKVINRTAIIFPLTLFHPGGGGRSAPTPCSLLVRQHIVHIYVWKFHHDTLYMFGIIRLFYHHAMYFHNGDPYQEYHILVFVGIAQAVHHDKDQYCATPTWCRYLQHTPTHVPTR